MLRVVMSGQWLSKVSVAGVITICRNAVIRVVCFGTAGGSRVRRIEAEKEITISTVLL